MSLEEKSSDNTRNELNEVESGAKAFFNQYASKGDDDIKLDFNRMRTSRQVSEKEKQILRLLKSPSKSQGLKKEVNPATEIEDEEELLEPSEKEKLEKMILQMKNKHDAGIFLGESRASDAEVMANSSTEVKSKFNWVLVFNVMKSCGVVTVMVRVAPPTAILTTAGVVTSFLTIRLVVKGVKRLKPKDRFKQAVKKLPRSDPNK